MAGQVPVVVVSPQSSLRNLRTKGGGHTPWFRAPANLFHPPNFWCFSLRFEL